MATTRYGNANVLLVRDGLMPVASGVDMIDEHNHPGSSDTTIHDLGSGSPEFTCNVFCPVGEFEKFADRRRKPTAMNDALWVMTFVSTPMRYPSGETVVQCRFKRV